MNYNEYRANGWFIGSGVVESACKTVVGARFKQSFPSNKFTATVDHSSSTVLRFGHAVKIDSLTVLVPL